MLRSLSSECLDHAAYQAARAYLDIYEGLEARPILSGAAERGGLEDFFAGSLPDEGVGVGVAQVLDEFTARIVPGSLGVPHPLYLGLLNCSPLPAAPLADLLVSALNNNSGAEGQGPAAAAAEREIMRFFSRAFYGDDRASGMIVPTGSYANLQAVVLARSRHFPAWSAEGPEARGGRPKVYVSRESHFSVTRAADVAGIGRRGVVPVETRGRGVMDPAALRAAIQRDVNAGAKPFLVVATAGTTGVGGIDPLREIAAICREYDLWFHVDACYGAGAAMLPSHRHLFDGIDEADSIAADPHKWFFVPLATSLLMVRDPDIELEVFDSDASYIPDQFDGDGWRRGIPTSRRASSLTLWMTIRAHGWNTIREACLRNIQLTRQLESALEGLRFDVLPDGELSIACARWVPPARRAEDVDALQLAIRREVVDTGRAWFGTVRHDGKTWLCFRLANLHTTEQHISRLAEMVYKAAVLVSRES